jgi:hypothetical protein|nr:MAG TPA: hypothetical protein [Caudoviricetes sp.]
MSESKKNTEVVENEPEAVVQAEKILMYVGPTIVGVASHGTVLNNGLTESLKATIEKEPAIRGLLIPIENAAAALREIDTKTGATYSLYEKVANYK